MYTEDATNNTSKQVETNFCRDHEISNEWNLCIICCVHDQSTHQIRDINMRFLCIESNIAMDPQQFCFHKAVQRVTLPMECLTQIAGRRGLFKAVNENNISGTFLPFPVAGNIFDEYVL
ncbi:uncharacterized protein LOC143184145 [Calliopsis andreniformis]|uniref:uncharacterized protein LOC143184145 n=1 Tax=Calliopsis andreniformis TaxID=337506 RepID=UPI003FCD73E8